jgi:Flp pilus assembly protein TadB
MVRCSPGGLKVGPVRFELACAAAAAALAVLAGLGSVVALIAVVVLALIFCAEGLLWLRRQRRILKDIEAQLRCSQCRTGDGCPPGRPQPSYGSKW